MKGLVVGLGEVGKALASVLSSVHDIQGYDLKYDSATLPAGEAPIHPKGVDILHICIPYSDGFLEAVEAYKEAIRPKYTVIHSTVPVGTSQSLQSHYSPIRGVHPHLEEGIRTFVTYLAPADKVLEWYFSVAGITIHQVESSRDLEAAKLWSLASYAWSIMLEKEIHTYCQEYDLDFETVYTHWTETYNQGYEALGMPNVRRPVLKHIPGKIGGHCVIPAVEKLKDQGTWLAPTLLGYNDLL